MDNRLHELTGAKQDQPSSLLLSKEGAEQVAAEVAGLADMIHKNTALTRADMQNFTGNLEAAAKVEIGGRRFSLEQLRSIPDLQKNIMIWQEILSGNDERCSHLTHLTPAVAAALAGVEGDSLYLDGLTSLDPDTTAALAGFGGRELWLESLASLDPATAAALTEFKGNALYLNGVVSLDPLTATALAHFKGKVLELDGLATLDKLTATALVQFKGNWLYLNRLASLDPATAAALAQFKGTLFCRSDLKVQIDRYKSQIS